jgi:hypothetical protein
MGRNPQAGGRRGEVAVSAGAISWALNLTPALPAGRAASPAARASSGLPSWPAMLGRMGQVRSRRWPLVPHPGLPGRTVRSCLGQLEARGIIGVCDPDIAVARIKRRPAAGRPTPGISPRSAGTHRHRDGGAGAPVPRPGGQGRTDQDPNESEVTGRGGNAAPRRDVDNRADEAQPWHPHPRPAQPAGPASHGDWAIHRSPGDVNALGRVRPRRVLHQPADTSPSHQPDDARSLQTVADRLGDSAHTLADRCGLTAQGIARHRPSRGLAAGSAG